MTSASSCRLESRCAAPGCPNPVVRRNRRGRPPLYCCSDCRQRAGQPVVEVDHDAADGRPVGRVWLVRLRCRDRWVVIADGLGRPSADYLAHQITDVLAPRSPTASRADRAAAPDQPAADPR